MADPGRPDVMHQSRGDVWFTGWAWGAVASQAGHRPPESQFSNRNWDGDKYDLRFLLALTYNDSFT